MDRKIDRNSWPREEIFNFLSATTKPHYMVTFRVDVTALRHYTKRHGLSFYYALTYLTAKATNAVENFRYTLRDGEIYLVERRDPSFTDIRKGSDSYYIVTMPCTGTLDEFCLKAKEKSMRQTTFLDQDDTDSLIFISCLPELDLMGLTNEGVTDPDDNTPRISWGKYTEQNGRITLGYSMEVNHRFVDGYHLQQFYKCLQSMIDELPAD